MREIPAYINSQTQPLEEEGIAFVGWPLGENTSVPSFQLEREELAECIDLKLNPGGQLETRGAVYKWSDTAIGSLVDAASVTLGGTEYTLCTDNASSVYKVYYMSTLTPTQVDTKTMVGLTTLVSYNDVALICDGSYLKYCEDTTTIKIAYDGGDDGTQYDNYSGQDDAAAVLTAGTDDRIAAKFTSQAWDAGYTIPITKIEAKVQESGGTAAITATLRLVSSDAVVATKAYTGIVPSASADYISIVFTSADVSSEMLPSTAYYACLEGSNFLVQGTTVASAGAAWVWTGSWAQTATSDPIMKVYPGRPPKASYGVVAGNRPWIKNPDEPGRAYYGNLTHLDWSTSGGGGYVGVVDDNANSFPIGGFEDLYGTLYVLGTEEHSFMCKLEGSTPSTYKLPLLFQKSWSTIKTLVNTNNDLWFSSATGTDNLTGIQEFGDLRTDSFSDPIRDAFTNWVTGTAIAGYHAADGQYWLNLGGTYTYICHTKQPIRMKNGKVRYPWSRYKLPVTPTFFKQIGAKFVIGCSDGYMYEIGTTQYKDLGTTQIAPSYKTAYVEMPFGTRDLVQGQIMASSINGSNIVFDFYKNGQRGTSELTKSLALAISDAITLADIENIPLADLENVTLTPVGSLLYFDLNINCYSFQVKVSSIHIAGKPVFINGMMFKFYQLEI